MKRCVFSGSTENLNTSMNIKLDDGSVVEAWISDEYADEATPRKVREAYIDTMDKYHKLIDDAKRMGINLTLNQLMNNQPNNQSNNDANDQWAQSKTANLNVSTRAKATAVNDTHGLRPAAPQPKPVEPKRPIIDESNVRKIDGKAADKPLDVNVMAEGSAAAMGNYKEYEITSGDKPTEDLKEGEIAEVKMVAGRQGMSVAIPAKRVGKTGTTEISVTHNYDDRKLQNDFKRLSTSQDGYSFGKDGYTVRYVRCTLCRDGQVMGKVCPKCNGQGEIMVNGQ